MVVVRGIGSHKGIPGRKYMRKRLTLLTAVVVASLIAAAAAWAGFPNFQRYKEPVLVYGGSTAGTLSLAAATTADATAFGDPRVFVDGIVVVGIKEGVTTTLTAPFEAKYVCVNGGNNVPSAENKVTLVGELEARADVAEAKTG